MSELKNVVFYDVHAWTFQFRWDVSLRRAAQTFSLPANFQLGSLQFQLPPHPPEFHVRISRAVRILSGSWFLSSPRNSKVDLDWREWSMECSKSNVRWSRETICEMFFKPALAVCSVWLSSINILWLYHNISVASTATITFTHCSESICI